MSKRLLDVGPVIGEVDAKDARELDPLAVAIGEAWLSEVLGALRDADREIIGAWPGTLREARMRIRIRVDAKLEVSQIDQLAHLAYVAARRGWDAVCERDPEV